MDGIKKKLTALLFCTGMIVFCVSCTKRTDVKTGDDYIYGINSEYNGLVKITYDVPKENAEEAAKAVLEELARPSEDIGYLPAIPKQVSIRGCKLEYAIVYVDFDEGYLELPFLEEQLTRAAVVQSLVRVEGINGVRFSVNGESLRNEEGKVIGLMNGDDFVEINGSSLGSYQSDTLTLYFANETGDKLVEETMNVNYSGNVSREKLIVQKLMAGPRKNGSYPTLNPGATLLSATIKDDVCYVSFDSEFLTRIYDVKPEIAIYSLINSLTRGTSASSVQITVNGEKNAVYMNTVDLSQPFSEDMQWVEGAEESEGETPQ